MSATTRQDAGRTRAKVTSKALTEPTAAAGSDITLWSTRSGGTNGYSTVT